MRRTIAIFALSSALTLSTFAPERAFAQGATAADAVKDVARQRFADGVAAFDAGRYEDARLAFQQAYSLTQVPAVLLNLGLSEVKAGRVVEGGNHLLRFLREAKDAKPEQIKSANDALSGGVSKRASLLTVSVDAQGADVSIDGAKVGVSPLPGPIYVEPGSRTVLATLGAKSAFAKVDAQRGKPSAATINLNAGAPPAIVAAPITAPAPAPANTTAPPPASPSGSQPAVPPWVDPVVSPNQTPPGSTPPPPEPTPSSSGRRPFLDWYLDRPLAWAGTGLAGLGFGLGIGFGVAASNSANDVEAIALAIRNEASSDGVTGAPCGPESGSGAGDVYPEACGALRDAIGVHDANNALTITGFVVGGLALAGTVTYAVFDWYLASPRDAGNASVNVGVMPVVTPTFQGLGAVGRF
jgi:hypothetical protein